jgi:hypothetical protein
MRHKRNFREINIFEKTLKHLRTFRPLNGNQSLIIKQRGISIKSLLFYNIVEMFNNGIFISAINDDSNRLLIIQNGSNAIINDASLII